MRRGWLARLRSGSCCPGRGRPTATGCTPNGPGPAAHQIDPVAAVVVQELFADYAAGGVTLHALAARLTRRQVPTSTGKPVWHQQRPAAADQPAYKGQAASGRLPTTPARRRKSALEPVGRGVRNRKPRPQEWITVPVPHWSPPSSSTWSSGGWPPTSAAPGAAPLTLPAARPGQLRALPGELQWRHPYRQRHHVPRLPLPGKRAVVSFGRPRCCPARFMPQPSSTNSSRPTRARCWHAQSLRPRAPAARSGA
jgi:hypothetical protein